jgi:hypothetical protein
MFLLREIKLNYYTLTKTINDFLKIAYEYVNTKINE